MGSNAHYNVFIRVFYKHNKCDAHNNVWRHRNGQFKHIFSPATWANVVQSTFVCTIMPGLIFQFHINRRTWPVSINSRMLKLIQLIGFACALRAWKRYFLSIDFDGAGRSRTIISQFNFDCGELGEFATTQNCNFVFFSPILVRNHSVQTEYLPPQFMHSDCLVWEN